MEIPLLSGRGFTAQDDQRAPQVAIVNQTFAREFFPDEEVLGMAVADDGEVDVCTVLRLTTAKDAVVPERPCTQVARCTRVRRATEEAVERAAKELFQIPIPDNGPRVDPNYKGKGLQIQITVEDEGAFTTPWAATVTFRRALDEWTELVCAENRQWHPGTYSNVPTADKPDF